MADNIASGGPATSHHSNKLLDTDFARDSPLTEEQFSFIIYHVDQEAGSADILDLLNNTFSLQENVSTVEQTILWIRCNVKREQLLLRRAKQYEWFPQTQAGNNEGRRRERKWTDDMRAFILWRYELGHRKLSILKSVNAYFNTHFNIGSLKSLDWWKPPPAPNSPEGVRAARHARRRAASKRHTERSEVQKRWINGLDEFESEGLQSPEATTGKGKTRAPTTAADGTLTRPIKIEDSDGDEEDTMSDVVLTHLNATADEMVQSPSDQLSPTPRQRAPPRHPRSEVDDGEMELSNDSEDEMYSSEDLPRSGTSNNRSGKGVSNFSAKLMGSRS